MVFRLRDFIIYPIAIKRFHDFLNKSQFWNPDKRRGWIQEKLDRILRHAVKNVPYYKETLSSYESSFDWIIDKLDLNMLPVLTKDDIRNNKNKFYAENYQQFRPNPTHTSGSTGTPTQFLLDRDSNITHFASIWRVLNWAGYRFSNRFADLTGYIPKNNKLFQYDMRLNSLHFSSFNFKKENMRLYMEKLKKFDPVLIKAYPSAIDIFCRWIREIKINNYQPKAIITCAETLLDHQKSTIEDVLQCPVYDFYNQNERAALISTCEKGSYHVHEEYSFVEFIDKKHSDINTIKEIVATSLHNFAMPLIRYQTNDLASVKQNRYCSCGRTYKVIDKIIGRIEDIIITPDGRYVGRLDAAFNNSAGVRLSQIVQESLDSIQVKVVKASNFSEKDINSIEKGLRIRLGDEIGISYSFVDEILPEKNGKVKFVISKLGKEIF